MSFKKHLFLFTIAIILFGLPSYSLNALELNIDTVRNLGSGFSQVTQSITESLPDVSHLLPAIDQKLRLSKEPAVHIDDIVANVQVGAALIAKNLVAASFSVTQWFENARLKLSQSVSDSVLPAPKLPTAPSINIDIGGKKEEPRPISPALPATEKKETKETKTAPVSNPSAAPIAPASTPSIAARVAGLEGQLLSMRDLFTRQTDRSSERLSTIVVQAVSGDSAVINAVSGTFASLSVTGGFGFGTATTTGANGIDISGGCFSLNGVCIAGGGSVGASVTGTYPILVNSNVVSLGFGTTTANSWGGAQTFLASTTLQAFSGTNYLALGSTTLQAFTSSSGTVATLLASNSTTTNLYVSSLASTTEIRANTGIIGSLTSLFGTFTNALFTGSTTFQAFSGTSGTTTNFYSGNILATASSTFQALRATSATSTNLYSTNFLANGSSTFQNFIGTSGTTTNFYTGNLLATASSTFQAFRGTSGTSTNFYTTNFLANGSSTLLGFVGTNYLALGSTTLQNFTATQGTTTNFFATTGNFGAASTDVVNFTAGTFNYLNRSTTTLRLQENAWVIATNTAAAAYPLMSFNNSAGTSTIQFFGATTTGLTAGVGMGIPMGQFVLIGDGKTTSGLSILKGSLCVDNDGWCTATTTGRISSISSYLGGADLAEMYQAVEYVEPGDVVSIVGGINVIKATLGQKDRMMGVVSTNPGVVLGTGPDADGRSGDVPIALAGRVLVKVSSENGAIHAGDYLTLSSITGVAARATKAGVTIGQALEDYSSSGVGKIGVFVKNSYYSGLPLDRFPGLTVSRLSTPEAILVALQSGAETSSTVSSDLTVDRMLAAVDIITPKLTAGLISAKTIESPTIDALSNRITTEAASLRAQILENKSALTALEDRVKVLETASSTTFSLAAVTEAVNGLFNSASEWVVGKITAAVGVFTKLCVGNTCIEEQQLIDLLNHSGQTGSSPAPSVSNPTPEPPPVSEPEAELEITSEPEPELEKVPEPVQEEASEAEPQPESGDSPEL